ncbi:PsbP domain-containing protein [Chloropicon primus]|uniref:PsbP domain-containing protein n=1 Tax=Chloropicon primus TaxID=1764295 RepID=A0A5B8MSV4_9CHLO|nr:PsbP domain-containing protein [Chloropicon primus]|eukprot:QDZ22705.1 PsbP domain-containing protein [Chloropicon primus]
MARKTKLDVLYSIRGYRRCFDPDNGYTFIFPGDWLADQTLYQRYARRVEQQNPLDPPSLKKKPRRDFSEPTAAFGPPGSTGELNVSVVVAPIESGFALKQLGTPSKAGELILNSFIAPPTQQDKVAELLSAAELDGGYYRLEYTVVSASKGWKRHNIAVYGTSNNNLLYTLNAQCNEKSWSEEKEKLFTVANSFRIL